MKKTFIKLQGINNSVVIIDPNSIIAYSPRENQTTLHLISGVDIRLLKQLMQLLIKSIICQLVTCKVHPLSE